MLSVLGTPDLLTRVDVAPDGRLLLETQDWATYWAPVTQLGNGEIDRSLDSLHSAWQSYIRSRFDRSWQREYCFRYFSLLDLVLSAHRKARYASLWLRVLRTAVGFECFVLRAPALGRQVVAAGTTTLRNPVYLLAKLKQPDALDDTQFLPLIACGDDRSTRLFYHYRQYRLSKDSLMSLSLYLAASLSDRPASFSLVDSLVGGLGSSGDPRVAQRTRRLWKRVVKPIIQAAYPNPSRPMSLELVDVGAGSGALTAALCRKLLAWSGAEGFSPRLRLWFVDLCLADPARFFRTADLRSAIDSLMFLGDDYRAWLARRQPLPRSSGLRIALASKLFNNLSRFSVCMFRTDVLPSRIVDSAFFKEGKHLPAYCLAPNGPGPEALMVSNSRVDLVPGRTFAQASLSEYYRALRLVEDGENESLRDGMFLPLRTFNPECLVTLDGASVLARLLEHCDRVLVEDADLRPKDLAEHLRTFSLHTLAVSDLTKTLGLSSNHAYLLWPRDSGQPQLGGERIW